MPVGDDILPCADGHLRLGVVGAGAAVGIRRGVHGALAGGIILADLVQVHGHALQAGPYPVPALAGVVKVHQDPPGGADVFLAEHADRYGLPGIREERAGLVILRSGAGAGGQLVLEADAGHVRLGLVNRGRLGRRGRAGGVCRRVLHEHDLGQAHVVREAGSLVGGHRGEADRHHVFPVAHVQLLPVGEDLVPQGVIQRVPVLRLAVVQEFDADLLQAGVDVVLVRARGGPGPEAVLQPDLVHGLDISGVQGQLRLAVQAALLGGELPAGGLVVVDRVLRQPLVGDPAGGLHAGDADLDIIILARDLLQGRILIGINRFRRRGHGRRRALLAAHRAEDADVLLEAAVRTDPGFRQGRRAGKHQQQCQGTAENSADLILHSDPPCRLLFPVMLRFCFCWIYHTLFAGRNQGHISFSGLPAASAHITFRRGVLFPFLWVRVRFFPFSRHPCCRPESCLSPPPIL